MHFRQPAVSFLFLLIVSLTFFNCSNSKNKLRLSEKSMALLKAKAIQTGTVFNAVSQADFQNGAGVPAQGCFWVYIDCDETWTNGGIVNICQGSGDFTNVSLPAGSGVILGNGKMNQNTSGIKAGPNTTVFLYRNLGQDPSDGVLTATTTTWVNLCNQNDQIGNWNDKPQSFGVSANQYLIPGSRYIPCAA